MGYTSVTVILSPAAGSGTHQPSVRRAAEARQIDVREVFAGDGAGALARQGAEALAAHEVRELSIRAHVANAAGRWSVVELVKSQRPGGPHRAAPYRDQRGRHRSHVM
jgi:hypothetical protein